MRQFMIGALFALVTISAAQITVAVAQTISPEQGPAQEAKTMPSTPTAKDLEGKDAFSSDGQQVGKVTKTNTLSDGNVKDIEIKSSGFLGFFATTYLIPIDKVSVKGGRVDLSITSEQVKQNKLNNW